MVEFVERVTTEGGDYYVPPAERIAVFDNDGTLWCEKPTNRPPGFLDGAQHPTLGRRLHDATYLPMVELLRYLEATGFANYIASGGDRDFMRPVTYAV